MKYFIFGMVLTLLWLLAGCIVAGTVCRVNGRHYDIDYDGYMPVVLWPVLLFIFGFGPVIRWVVEGISHKWWKRAGLLLLFIGGIVYASTGTNGVTRADFGPCRWEASTNHYPLIPAPGRCETSHSAMRSTRER